MVLFKDFEISIQVNGQSLEELGADLDNVIEENTITRYVEATGGAQFSICGKFVDKEKLPGGARVKGISYHMSVDGTLVAKQVNETQPYPLLIDKAREWKDSQRFTGKLLFSSLLIVDTEHSAVGYDEARHSEPKMRKAGIIELQIFRVGKCTPSSNKRPDSILRPVVDEAETVPETALKGDSKSHYTQFGTLVLDPVRRSICDYIDQASRPYATFRFKYRSRRSLEELHVVPQPPPLEERNEDELTPAELKELVIRYKKRESEQANVDRKIKHESGIGKVIGFKRRRNSDDDSVTEAGERPAQRWGSSIPILPGDPVDLTED